MNQKMMCILVPMTPMEKVLFMVRRVFLIGFLTGVMALIVVLVVTSVSLYWYWNDTAKTAAVYVSSPVSKNSGANQVQLYFPLEKFLVFSSTANLQLTMISNQVRVRMFRQPFSALPVTLTIDILGVPNVWHGFFMLKKVKGYVDHIPIPTDILFTAIAAEGGKYDVRVNSQRDTLFIDRTFGAYRLTGYDTLSKDLIISMPVSTVLKAAREQTTL
jgi:hypothetical protein